MRFSDEEISLMDGQIAASQDESITNENGEENE